MPAGLPSPDTAVPAAMREFADGPVTLVWQNEVGGLTGRTGGPGPMHVKWDPAGSPESLVDECERLTWLSARHPAPEVVALRRTADGDLLATRSLPARSAVDPVWRVRPAEALRALGAGLRTLHDLPVRDCPWRWDVPTRVEAAAREGIRVPDALRDAPEIDRLVVCHGDACAPNTLIDDDGRFAGHVDVARLGVADRWADLAVATLSLGWNYDAYDEGAFWEAYGVAPDAERIAFCRALWDAT